MVELSQWSQNLCFGPRNLLLFLNRFSLVLLFITNGVAALWDSSLQYSPCWLAKPYRDVPVTKEVPTLLVVLGGSLLHSAYSHHSRHGQSLDFSSKDKQKNLSSCPSVHHNLVDNFTLEMRNSFLPSSGLASGWWWLHLTLTSPENGSDQCAQNIFEDTTSWASFKTTTAR